jgi:hypothetical protein
MNLPNIFGPPQHPKRHGKFKCEKLLLSIDRSRSGSVLVFLRLEGLAVAAVSAAVYARTGANWWLFAALWLVPDLSMLGYLGPPCWGARIYNAVHSYIVPAALGFSALLLHAHSLLPLSLIWVNHIGVDRLMGYGLKYADGFGWTHLGRLGKRGITAAAQS